MTREILFKAKRKDNREWVEGYIFRLKGTDRYFIFTGKFDVTGLFPNFIRYEVIQETICQYTGLTDKNGQKIWENDIVQYCDCTVENYVIAWESDKACFEYQQYGCSMMNFDELSGMEVEVIGNIFDSPELLEGE